jgi:hypothetical protein
MKRRFTEPHPNQFDPLETVLKRIEAEYQEKPVLIMAGVEALPKIKENNSGWANTIGIRLQVYQTGRIYHALAYNGSLVTAYPLFKSVLDDEEQKQFDALFGQYEYQKAVDFLTENTF